MSNSRATTLCQRCGAWLGPRDLRCDQCGVAVNIGDPFAGIAPPSPPPADRAKPQLGARLSKGFVIVGALAAAALLAFAGVMEYGTHANLSYKTDLLMSTKGELSSTRGQLSSTRRTLSTTRNELNDLRTTLDSTTSQLSSAQAQIQQLQQQVTGQQTTITGQQNTISGQKTTIATQGAEIADLNTCLRGVATALLDINYYNDLQAGINELNSVDTVCTRAEKNLPPG